MDSSQTSVRPDWIRLREDFPLLREKMHGRSLVYLDNAATTQKPVAVLKSIEDFYRRDNGNVHRAVHELSHRATEAFESARDRAARFLNAGHRTELIFTRGATESINLVASSWGSRFLRAGDTVLLTELEHHSNIVPWQLAAERAGAKVRFLPVADASGALRLDLLDAWLDSSVKLLAFSHVSNALGSQAPASEICARARKKGIVTLVDAAQSAGHQHLDVRELDCDFLAFSGHKMCGPTGIGVLYGRRELLEQMPPYQGGGDMISEVTFAGSRWNDPPSRFEAGTPHIEGAVGLASAMDYLDEIGRNEICRHDRDLANHARELVGRISGITMLGPSQAESGILSFQVPGIHSHDIVSALDGMGIAVRGGHHCAQPLMNRLGLEGSVRASFYLYNLPEESAFLAESLRETLALFR
jgi:cysteine desulfurase/selenocysteine lyase